MFSNASLEPDSTATLAISEAIWDNAKQSNETAPVPKPKVLSPSSKLNNAISAFITRCIVMLQAISSFFSLFAATTPDVESPISPNKDNAPPEALEIFAEKVEEASFIAEKASALAVSEWSVDPEFCFDDSDITFKKRHFWVHAFKLNEFGSLSDLVEGAQKDSEGRKTVELSGNVEDFHNMLTVLYSSAYAPQNFDATTLKSTLRLATIYNHPQLREFSIQGLKKLKLSPIERFALSRDCNVELWMSKALDDLCWKEEPITVKEAEVLGTKMFVELAARREHLKFLRCSRMKSYTALLAAASGASDAAKQTLRVSEQWTAPTPPADSTSPAAPMPDEEDSGTESLPSSPEVRTHRKVAHDSAPPKPTTASITNTTSISTTTPALTSVSAQATALTLDASTNSFAFGSTPKPNTAFLFGVKDPSAALPSFKAAIRRPC
ncbi:hypothetical protein BDV93DRAFT_557826 [Ceratobasidium sp. AG-I]|nr:hypothetical protein BDV93DRAFT_557826 [Ceratobasidium sp. AG-I]